MSRKTQAAFVVLVAGATVSLATLAAMAYHPQDDRGPDTKGAFPKKGMPGGGGPPGGFGPGMFLGPAVFATADADKDGKVSPEEAAKAAADLVRGADKDKKGSVDAQALGRAINAKLPPPPGFEPEEGDEPRDLEMGPGRFFAAGVIASADTDKDGRLSPEEAAKAAETFVRDADTAKKGGLDSGAMAQSINRRMGPPGGMGPGGPFGGDRKLVKTFDNDKDGRLNRAERVAARESVKKERQGRPMGFGPPPGMFGEDEKGTPGPKVEPSEVAKYPGKPLYDPSIIRTLFLDFEDSDWEGQMADFYNSDVELPATLKVDGTTYPKVGVHFRGLSSFMAVHEGQKRSLNISIDHTDPKLRLLGYKTLNLLNSHEDPTFLHTVLYFDIARHYLAVPKANFVKVVINGESWGLYVNAQQFDKTFTAEAFGHGGDGARWKVKGNPGGGGGLEYVGDKVEDYKRRFDLKTKDDPKAWKALITLCKTLNETPPDQLEAALSPMLDIDAALWFLAVDNALVNNDGYWVRASDYSIFQDTSGKFHVIPHDANETFQNPMMMGFGGPGGPGGGGPRGPGGPGGFGGGPGGPGGPGGGPGGFAKKAGGPPGGGMARDLDPLIGLDDDRKPLRSKLLAVPALKARYLDHVRTIAVEWLDWQKLGPVVERYTALIGPEIQADTRKLTSYPAFQKAVSPTVPVAAPDAKKKAMGGRGPGGPSPSLREFAEKRRAYLLKVTGGK